MRTSGALDAFLSHHGDLVLVEVAEARGSTPRERGAWMLVAPDAIWGTIGGGQLEFLAIDAARAALAGRQTDTQLDVPLGPEIGQCCGGRVGLSLRVVDDGTRDELRDTVLRDEAAQPAVFLFGAGHVGHALAQSLSLLPLRTIVVETRAEALEGLSGTVEQRLTPVPEETVHSAPPGSAFVILTHDHALDFLLASEALRRPDAAYVGMIGSATKRATFRRWFRENAGGTEAEFARLVCPIGGAAVRDKRPAVIAALATAEIMTALAAVSVPDRSSGPRSA